MRKRHMILIAFDAVENCSSISAQTTTKQIFVKICWHWKHRLELESARAALCKWATRTHQNCLSKTFAKLAKQAEARGNSAKKGFGIKHCLGISEILNSIAEWRVFLLLGKIKSTKPLLSIGFNVNFFRTVLLWSIPMTQPWKWSSMATTGSVVVWIAVSDGTSRSTVWNVAAHSPSMALTTSFKTTGEQTPTNSKHLRLEVTAREFPREPYEWESMSEIAWVKYPEMLLPGGTPWPGSWLRSSLHLRSRAVSEGEKVSASYFVLMLSL